MPDKNKLTEDLKHFEELEAKDHDLIQKLNEFIVLLEKSDLDTNNIKEIQVNFNNAITNKLKDEKLIKEIKHISLSDIDKLEQLNQLENILLNGYLDSKQTKKQSFKEIGIRAVKIVLGFLFITLGFAMIIMPAPPYFEMFTIFHFTTDDGVTLMDLISLIIIALGVFIVLRSALTTKSNE